MLMAISPVLILKRNVVPAASISPPLAVPIPLLDCRLMMLAVKSVPASDPLSLIKPALMMPIVPPVAVMLSTNMSPLTEVLRFTVLLPPLEVIVPAVRLLPFTEIVTVPEEVAALGTVSDPPPD